MTDCWFDAIRHTDPKSSSDLPQDEFLEMLKAHHVVTLIDVRSRPYSSHNPQFNKRELSGTVKSIGIQYEFEDKALGGLGDVSVKSSEFTDAIHRVLSLQEHGHVAMMCAEKNPADCHRAFKLAAWLHNTTSPRKK